MPSFSSFDDWRSFALSASSLLVESFNSSTLELLARTSSYAARSDHGETFEPEAAAL
jgi:hypothetical protein